MIVTGVAIPAENDVIDLTVTAQQGFGGRRPPKKKYTGERIFCKTNLFLVETSIEKRLN